MDVWIDGVCVVLKTVDCASVTFTSPKCGLAVLLLNAKPCGMSLKKCPLFAIVAHMHAFACDSNCTRTG